MRSILSSALIGLLGGCAQIDPEMLHNFDTATGAGQTYLGETNARATREYRLARLEQEASSDTGKLRPRVAADSHALRQLAQDVLCNAQTVYYTGSAEARAAAALGRDVRSFDVTPPDTIVGNIGLLASPPPLPSQAQDVAVAQQTAPASAPAPVPGLQQPAASAPNTLSSQSVRPPIATCVSDFDSTRTGALGGGGTEAGTLAALLDLESTLDTTLKPKIVAVLQIVVRARQHQRLMRYLRVHDGELHNLAESLRQLDEPLRRRAETTRRLRSFQYAMAFDAMRRSLRRRTLGRGDQLSIVPIAATDLSAHAPTQTALDAAAAYDAALSDPTPTAFRDLAQAIDHLRELPRHNDAAATAASIRATLTFVNALRAFADATRDPTLKQRVHEVESALH